MFSLVPVASGMTSVHPKHNWNWFTSYTKGRVTWRKIVMFMNPNLNLKSLMTALAKLSTLIKCWKRYMKIDLKKKLFTHTKNGAHWRRENRSQPSSVQKVLRCSPSRGQKEACRKSDKKQGILSTWYKYPIDFRTRRIVYWVPAGAHTVRICTQ